MNDDQAFVLAAKIVDTESAVVSYGEAFFIADQKKYSEKFASVIRGSLFVKLARKNGDKI